MERKNGPWTIRSSKTIYQNEHLHLVEDQVLRPDGAPGTYASVRMQPGVTVLPVDDSGHVFLTRQFRYAVGRECLEAASGGADPGEELLEAARREAREELGIEAAGWQHLGRLDLATSTISAPTDLFLARDLSFTQPDREGTETIRTVKMKLDEAFHLVLEGEITHAPTCVIILKAHLTGQI